MSGETLVFTVHLQWHKRSSNLLDQLHNSDNCAIPSHCSAQWSVCNVNSLSKAYIPSLTARHSFSAMEYLSSLSRSRVVSMTLVQLTTNRSYSSLRSICLHNSKFGVWSM